MLWHVKIQKNETLEAQYENKPPKNQKKKH